MIPRRPRALVLFAAVHVTFLLLAASAYADPVVDKRGMVFHLVPHEPDKAEWMWTPQLRFRVSGPISSSATLEIQYTFPNGKPWLKVQCDSGATEANEWLTLDDCGGRQEDKVATAQTGVFGFRITLSDALSNTTATLVTGKFTVGRGLYNPSKQPDRNKQGPARGQARAHADVHRQERQVDTGAAVANNVATEGALVPVTVHDTGDGAWRKDAWKTEAFFANQVTAL